MKAELQEHGPIACAIQATDDLEQKYTGGIFRSYTKKPIQLNHSIAVVGWGTDPTSGDQYWVVRNSWGTYWGEQGFFRVPIGDETINLGVQTDCIGGIPSFEQAPKAKELLEQMKQQQNENIEIIQ